jgi:hypothetical protein
MLSPNKREIIALTLRNQSPELLIDVDALVDEIEREYESHPPEVLADDAKNLWIDIAAEKIKHAQLNAIGSALAAQ